MIVAMLLFTARHLRRRWARLAAAALLAFLAWPAASAQAQGVEGGYLPSGGGAFVPFRGGPGGGLGVMPSGPRTPVSSPSSSSLMGGMAGGGSTLGAPNGLTSLRPIGGGGSPGMGSGGLLDRSSNAPSMKPMRRPPVGSYPFRIPPSLRGGSSQRPSMAM
ncbi:hypothetical protein [Paludisphaera mucosa]|uniref:Uncharacterized protein n=1 Tax=Paludisphaera mucosa TaxID=3030827 RepID=A0ABT6FAB7_9BACT|nr:hypothetical protein [Paludisphaera mucosa]MDG3004531.1 hypothetical protein [Paludisphaera mucosa]